MRKLPFIHIYFFHTYILSRQGQLRSWQRIYHEIQETTCYFAVLKGNVLSVHLMLLFITFSDRDS